MTDDRTHPAVRQAVGALTGVIGWIGASVAGLTALCYGAGYFVIHTHLTMLGLSGVVDVPTDQLLLEGGRFFYLTLEQMAVGAMIVVVTAAAICLICWAIYRVPVVGRNKAVGAVRDRMTSAKAKSVASSLLPLGVIAIVLLHFNFYYDTLIPILGFKNLAFAVPKTVAGSLASDVAAMILSGREDDRAALVDAYEYFVEVYALFLAVTWLMVYKGGATAFGKAANFLFIIYALLLTAFLPFAFGVLVRAPFYPVANLVFKNGQQTHGLILQRTERNILVWDPVARSAASYRNEDVPSFRVVGDRDIFEKEQRP